MDRRPLFSFVRLILTGGALASLVGGASCSKGSDPEAHPLRQKVVGHWSAGRPTTIMSLLDLNEDGTFKYVFDTHSHPALKLSGTWTIDDNEILGQINSAENGGYKLGDTFDFGKIVFVDDTTLKLGRTHSIDEYQHPPPPPPDANKK